MSHEKTLYAFRLIYCHLTITVMRLLEIGLFMLILVFLLPYAVPFIENANSYSYISGALKIEKAIHTAIPHYLPTKIAGKDVTILIMFLGIFILAMIIGVIKNHFIGKKRNLLPNRELKHMQPPDDEEWFSTFERKLQKLNVDNKDDNEKLWRLFAETKRRLGLMGKDLAFLSVGVVSAKGIKGWGKGAIVEHDFTEYRKLVESKLMAHKVLKMAWTIDGVMSCFPTVDDAIWAANEIIDSLEVFNRNVKTLKNDFQVRCGINYGFVYFDGSMFLGDISERVVEIAANIQKQAKPNTICIAKSMVEPIYEQSGFVPTGIVVDGREVYVWERKNRSPQN